MSIVYFRDQPLRGIAPAISPRWTDVGAPPHRRGQKHGGYSWLAKLREWRRRRRSRTSLTQLNASMLKDIGLTYAEAEKEANKPFWLP